MSTGALLFTIGETIGSSGITTVAYNWWSSRKTAKKAVKVQDRGDIREPHILQGLELSNLTKAVDLVAKVNEMLTEEIRDSQGRFEDRLEDLSNENDRFRSDLIEAHQEISNLKSQLSGSKEIELNDQKLRTG